MQIIEEQVKRITSKPNAALGLGAVIGLLTALWSSNQAMKALVDALNVVYGERDAIAWPEVEARFAALRTVRPDAWTGMVPGAGHWVAYEAAPAFDAMLLDMLDRRRRRG